MSGDCLCFVIRNSVDDVREISLVIVDALLCFALVFEAAERDCQDESCGKDIEGQMKPVFLHNNTNTMFIVSYPNYNHSMACARSPSTDAYFGGLFTPYGQHAIAQMAGSAPTRIPLPLDLAEDGPIYVNAKQYHGILRRRQYRAKLEAQNSKGAALTIVLCINSSIRINNGHTNLNPLISFGLNSMQPYLHESRHLHALKMTSADDNGFGVDDTQLTLQILSTKARVISTSKALLQYFNAQAKLCFQNPHGVPVHIYCGTKELEISLTELSLDILLFVIGKLNLAGPFSVRSSMILANCCKVENHTGLNHFYFSLSSYVLFMLSLCSKMSWWTDFYYNIESKDLLPSFEQPISNLPPM
ncbi:hypothetical protein REPUB_Repub06bG0147500 [Reevesia pubescens]